MARSSVVTVDALPVLPPKIATSVSIAVNPMSGVVPFLVTITGNLVDIAGVGLPNKQIKLYMNGAWVGATPTHTNGAYVIEISIPTAGTYQFQTEFPGDDAYEGCSAHDGTTATSILPPLELDLPTIAGITIAIADLALVGYYALTQVPKKF